MALAQGSTQSPSNNSSPDGSQPVILAGKAGEIITTELHGKYYTQCYRGSVFAGSQAVAGAVVPIYTNTTQQCGLWNPAGSGVNLVPIKLNIGYVSTTGAAGGFALGYVLNCGAGLGAAGSGITAATMNLLPVNCNLQGPKSKAIWMSAGITCTAPALLMTLGINQLVTTAAVATIGFFEGKYEFDGHIVVPQGTAIFFSGMIALLLVASFTCIWEEVPA